MPNRARRRTLVSLAGCLLAACSTVPGREPVVLTAVIETASPAVVALGDAKNLLGSGFRIAGTRLIATAAHVVTTPAASAVTGAAVRVRWQQQNYSAHIRRIDAATDVAVLELDGEPPMPGLVVVPAGREPRVGEWILVIGCPFGTAPTATVGIVSAPPGAIAEPPTLRGLVQLNAAVNAGNSGGPVLNLKGEVIGIASAVIPGGFGLGFAVPAHDLRALLSDPATK